MTALSNNESQHSRMCEQPRRRAAAEIKLLRLELRPQGHTPCEDIGSEWSPAQPIENLSPDKAAHALGVEIWAIQSQVRKRYRTLQLRYPPEQFLDRHVEWRPSAELLGKSRYRLNWFWQSGLIPSFFSNESPEKSPLWNRETVEPSISAQLSLVRFLSHSSCCE